MKDLKSKIIVFNDNIQYLNNMATFLIFPC